MEGFPLLDPRTAILIQITILDEDMVLSFLINFASRKSLLQGPILGRLCFSAFKCRTSCPTMMMCLLAAWTSGSKRPRSRR